MVRYLSPGWFARLEELRRRDAAGLVRRVGDLVLRHEVAESPDGPLSYDVVVGPDGPTIVADTAGRPDVIFRTDYATAAAIASGRQSVDAALADGAMRVSGNVGALTGRSSDLTGADPVPAALRAETEY